jgi:hypothetical protein
LVLSDISKDGIGTPLLGQGRNGKRETEQRMSDSLDQHDGGLDEENVE